MKCIICGGWIPDGTMAKLKSPKGKPDYFTPREVCLDCASEEKKRAPARKMQIPDDFIDQAVQLAGAISQSCLSLYKKLYEDAVKEVRDMGVLRDVIYDIPEDEDRKDPVGKFLRYHKDLHKRQALNLSLGMMPELLAYTRRKECEKYSGSLKRAAKELEAMLEV